MDKKTQGILITLAVVAFLLRWYLMQSHLFFGPEQGRDFLVIKDIVENHKLTLIGSKTDVNGIFHGPIYYYLAALPFAVSVGNPLIVSAFFIFIQSITVFVAYLLTYELSQSKRAGYIAAALFAISYQSIVYARWLSNPPLSIPLSILYILFLLRFLRGRQSNLIFLAITYGFLGQVEFINYLLFGVIGVAMVIIYWKKFIQTKPIILIAAAIIGFVVSFGTYALFDVRHNFLISNAIIQLLQDTNGRLSLDAFDVFWKQFTLTTGGFIW